MDSVLNSYEFEQFKKSNPNVTIKVTTRDYYWRYVQATMVKQ